MQVFEIHLLCRLVDHYFIAFARTLLGCFIDNGRSVLLSVEADRGVASRIRTANSINILRESLLAVTLGTDLTWRSIVHPHTVPD